MTESSIPPSAQHSSSDHGGPTPTTRHKRKVAMLILGGVFLFLSLLWLFYWLIWGQFEVYTDDAYVNGNIVQLMPQVPGTVVAISTDDTQLVLRGQPIIKLDPTDMDIRLQKEEALLADTVRQVRQHFENVKRARADLVLRKADLKKAQLDLKRRTGLIGSSAVSREELQHYKTAAEAASSRYIAALHALGATQALVENSHLYTNPFVEAAKARFKAAYLNAKRTTILSPLSGYIAKRNVQVGQQVRLNTAMLAIIPLNAIWVEANYKESQLDYLRIGQSVTLYADAYPDVTYHGKVEGLGAGTGAAFSLLPPQNATGNWIKIVQRLPVRIALDAEELKKHPLQLGLSMRVTINIHNLSGSRLAQAAENKVRYETNIYAHQLSQANQMIEKILKDNAPNVFITNETMHG